ncbi:MAG: ATP-binding protein [Halopseudomonas aestusnigri]
MTTGMKSNTAPNFAAFNNDVELEGAIYETETVLAPIKTIEPKCPSGNAFAIFDSDGSLTNYSDNFNTYFKSITDFIKLGVSYQTLTHELVERDGAYLDEVSRKEWTQRLNAHMQGETPTIDFSGLGALRILSNRIPLQDGGALFNFDNSLVLPSTLSEILVLSRQVLAAIDDIDLGFILYDDKGRMIYCNTRHRELYPEIAHLMVPGVDRREVLEAYWDKVGNVVSKIDKGTRKNNHSNTARGTKERQLPNGRWLQINEKPTQGNGIVAIRTEITDLKAHQSALYNANERLIAQAEELESASIAARQATEAKSNFLSTMSHEIRTPLNGIIGMSQLLSGSILDDEQQTKLDTIISSGQILLEIINNILDMSKIEAGNVDLELTAFDLPALINSTISPLQTLAEDHGLYLKNWIEDGVSQYIRSDGTRLRQILTNLLSNAIKFTLSGGITLSLEELSNDDPRCIDLKYPVGKKYSREEGDTIGKILLFSVTDTGTGIAADRIEAIFNPFTQEDDSITRKFGGTGLGLSIVKSLVEMLGGTISVSSTANFGSRFDVILPCQLPDRKEIDQLQAMSKPLETLDCPALNILIAEDNMVNAMIAKAFIEKFGHHTLLVSNGAQAVKALDQQDIDLIVMDVHMPQMDGIEATIAIRNGNTQPNIPIIGLTAEAFSERHAYFRSIGMTDVLSKPFTEQQLKSIIHRNYVLIDQKHRDEKMSTEIDSQTEAAEDNTSDESNSAAISPKKLTQSVTKTPDQNTEVYIKVPTINHDETPIGSEKQLEEIRAQIGDEVLAELLAMAPDTINTHTENLLGAIKTEDSDAIYLAAHTIMGTAGSMFATRLANVAKEMEGVSKDTTAALALAPTLEKAAAETIAWWQSKMV